MRVKHADPAGAPDCRALLNELLARERSDLRRMRVHALTIDAWTVQHADHASAESVTAVGVHLVSLYSQWVLGLPYRAAKQIRREAAATIDFRRLPPPESTR